MRLLQATRNQASLDEYRTVREQRFETNMKLIEAEALFKNRKAEIEARNPGVDPELMIQKRIKDALRKDPEIASKVKEIEQALRKVDKLKRITRSQADPSLVHAESKLASLNKELRDLIAWKEQELCDQDEESCVTSEVGVADRPR